jgi:hypothetical protein
MKALQEFKASLVKILINSNPMVIATQLRLMAHLLLLLTLASHAFDDLRYNQDYFFLPILPSNFSLLKLFKFAYLDSKWLQWRSRKGYLLKLLDARQNLRLHG